MVYLAALVSSSFPHLLQETERYVLKLITVHPKTQVSFAEYLLEHLQIPK